MIKEINTSMLVLTKIDDKVYFYVPAEEGKKRLRCAITDPNLDAETAKKAKQMHKALRRYYTVIKDEVGEFKIKFE